MHRTLKAGKSSHFFFSSSSGQAQTLHLHAQYIHALRASVAQAAALTEHESFAFFMITKQHKPKGLIQYFSQNIHNNNNFRWQHTHLKWNMKDTNLAESIQNYGRYVLHTHTHTRTVPSLYKIPKRPGCLLANHCYLAESTKLAGDVVGSKMSSKLMGINNKHNFLWMVM